jgi:hypothetical protein
VRHAGAGDEEDALEVCVDEFVPVGVGRVFERDRGRVYAGAVEDVIDFAEFLDGSGDEGVDLLGVSDVDGLGIGLGLGL